jgi:hypothetical protein
LETAPRHGLGSSFRATREAADKIFRRTGRFRTSRSTQILDRRGAERLLRPEFQAFQRGSPLPPESLVAHFNPLIDDGFLRIGARFEFADLSRKHIHPILLNGSHHFTAQLIMQTHNRLHHLGFRIVLSELREEFWILRGRQAIKKLLYTCLPCKIAKNPFGLEREAPMPADKITASKPFQVTGIDFAGPLYVKGRPLLKQCYAALFTCPTIRAVYLELCSDITTDTFLLAFQRFIGRRGIRIPFILTMRKRSTRQIGSSRSYGGPSRPPKLIASLPSTASSGNPSLPGRLGGEDGGKGW